MQVKQRVIIYQGVSKQYEQPTPTHNAKFGRGKCDVCRKSVAITAQNTLRNHRVRDRLSSLCEGSGQVQGVEIYERM